MGAQLPSELAFLPPGAWIETFPRRDGSANSAPLASGRMLYAACWLDKGWEITSVAFATGAVGATAPTNQWVALYRPNLARLAVTADDGAAAWPADMVKTFSFSAPALALERGVHYLGLVVVATVVPSLSCAANRLGLINLVPQLAGTGASGLTTPATAPNPLTLGAGASPPYAYVS